MFGIDFSELLVIMAVALLVIGPERLPKVARTFGHMWGRAERYVKDIKAGIEREMAIDELSKFRQSIQDEASRAEQTMRQVTQTIDQQALQLSSSVAKPDKAVTQAVHE